MRVQRQLMGAGAALALALAAQAANAQTCPNNDGGNDGGNGGGGGVYLQELGDGTQCPEIGGSVAWNETVTQPDGTSYEAEAEVPDGSEFLPAGEYIEVEIDLDTTVALLKSDDALAMKAAVALGLRDPSVAAKYAAFAGGSMAQMGKLSDIELKLVARHVHSAMKVQNRGRGRSDTSNGFLTRATAWGQAASRAVGSWIGRLPTGNLLMGTRTYYPNGNLRSESGIVLRLERQEEPN